MLKVRKISKEFPYLFFESSLPMFISENFLSEIMNRYDFRGLKLGVRCTPNNFFVRIVRILKIVITTNSEYLHGTITRTGRTCQKTPL